jgi:aminobenzoyl-glutamate transport protein
MYVALTLIVVVLSWVLRIYGVEAVVPATGEVVRVQSPLTPEGVRWFLRQAVGNFTGFSPFGAVVVYLLGLGVALHSGFVEACVRGLCRQGIRGRRLLLMVVVLGVLSNVVGDAGYVVLLPLSAALFSIAGLSPVAGLIAAHVSATCCFSANVMGSTLDTLMSRITNEASAQTAAAAGGVGRMSCYCFMAVSALVLAAVIYLLMRRQVAPGIASPVKPLSHRERRSLFMSLLIGVLYALLVAVGTFSSFGILRDAGGGLLQSPFVAGLLFIVAFGFGVVGLVYGLMSGRYRTDRDFIFGLLHFSSPLGQYIVIALFASQMFAVISYTGVDRIAVSLSAGAFSAAGMSGLWCGVVFIVFVALLNIIMASASAKWSIMASALMPALVSAGMAPEQVLCAFRIGDSISNGLTPLMPYMPLLFALWLHYEPAATYATLLRRTWRLVLCVSLSWVLLYVVWSLAGLPAGI